MSTTSHRDFSPKPWRWSPDQRYCAQMRLAGILAMAIAVLGAGALPSTVPSAQASAPSAATAPAVAAETAELAADVGPPVSRIAGSNRYGSAVEISERAFADPADATVVYLARGDNFSDALTAGTLSDGPVLLVRGGCGSVPTEVLAEIDRLDPTQVIALGGSAAVCDEALAAAARGRATDRIGGANREATAALIAERAFPDGAPRVYLTRGEVNADAVVGGSLRDGPILLTSVDGRSVPEETAATIATLAPGAVVALGGSAAVSDAALIAAADGRPTDRLSGSNRYATAVAIARYAYPSRTSQVYLARGDGTNFVDAVASGMLTDGPVLLTPGTCERVREVTGSFLEQRDPSRIVALGGSAALCTSTLRGASLDARPDPDCAQVACVALTFDDGPSRYTPRLLDLLWEERVPATFFVVGQQVDAYPAYSRRAYVEGHPIANHTWNHTQLTTLNASGQRSQLERVNTELAQHRIPRTEIMRPPYGSYNATTRTMGYPVIIWDVDPRDWENSPSAATVRSRVVNGTRSGSIVLQHDIHPNSVEAVRGIIDDLHARGYTLVTVDELVPSMRDGDVVFRRDRITRSGTAVSPSDTIVLPDGTEIGPLVDESGVPGLAPDRSAEEVLDATE